MTATSEFCLPRRSRRPRHAAGVRLAAGFTLVEILVVLVILGLTLGLTISSLEGYRTRSRIESEARAMSAEIMRAQHASLLTGRAQEVDMGFLEKQLRDASETGRRANSVPPEGLKVSIVTALRIGHDGACSDGQYELEWRGLRYRLVVSAPFCDSIITRVD